MLVGNALDALKDAKADKRDWREVSGIVNEILETRAWRGQFENMTAWFEAAGEASGYSSSILRRMVAVRDFLAQEKDAFGVPDILVDTTTRAPFAAMELLKRIHDIDPVKAKEVFRQILAGEVSHRNVQAIYHGMLGSAAPRQGQRKGDGAPLGGLSGRGRVNPLLQAGPAIIEENLAKLTGDAQARFYFREFRFSYASPTAVALRYKDNGIAWIDGFDFRWSGRVFQGIRRRQMLAEIAFGASFFRNYWVVIEQAGEAGRAIAKDVKQLDLHSVGIAEVDLAKPDKMDILLKPELSAQPDRQGQAIREVMGQGIPDFVDF